MKFKYPEDDFDDEGNLIEGSKNRFVDPAEHELIERDDDDEAGEGEEQRQANNEVAAEDDGESSSDESLEELTENESAELQKLLKAFEEVQPEDPESYFPESTSRLVSMIIAGEDNYETPPEQLPPLPSENDPNYPQENPAYFTDKVYVRTDKWELKSMLFDEIDLPDFESAFSH